MAFLCGFKPFLASCHYPLHTATPKTPHPYLLECWAEDGAALPSAARVEQNEESHTPILPHGRSGGDTL